MSLCPRSQGSEWTAWRGAERLGRGLPALQAQSWHAGTRLPPDAMTQSPPRGPLSHRGGGLSYLRTRNWGASGGLQGEWRCVNTPPSPAPGGLKTRRKPAQALPSSQERDLEAQHPRAGTAGVWVWGTRAGPRGTPRWSWGNSRTVWGEPPAQQPKLSHLIPSSYFHPSGVTSVAPLLVPGGRC